MVSKHGGMNRAGNEGSALTQFLINFFLGVVCLVLFFPSASFFFQRIEAAGIVLEAERPKAVVKFYDYDRREHTTHVKWAAKAKGANKGSKVKVYYRAGHPTDVRIYAFEGGFPYFVSIVFELLGLATILMAFVSYGKARKHRR